jgi:hypothetical protein
MGASPVLKVSGHWLMLLCISSLVSDPSVALYHALQEIKKAQQQLMIQSIPRALAAAGPTLQTTTTSAQKLIERTETEDLEQVRLQSMCCAQPLRLLPQTLCTACPYCMPPAALFFCAAVPVYRAEPLQGSIKSWEAAANVRGCKEEGN